jgi:AraC-like DNA-binding protein
MFHQRVPRRPLDAAIQSVWVYSAPPGPFALERILPTGRAQLIVNLTEDRLRAYATDPPYRCTTGPGTVLAGVSSRHAVIDTAETEHVAGVTFAPGGLSYLFNIPAYETRDVDVSLEDLWGRAQTMMLRERLLESRTPAAALDVLEDVLLQQWRPESLHKSVVYALDVFHRVPHLARIDAVSRTVGLSPKRFIERFTREVGVTPKRFCRLRRFQRVTTRIHEGQTVDWAQLAIECGYADQAHFNHEFREFSGLTPRRYLAQRGPFQNHVKILQSPAG